jgi:hypothetical protein
MDALDVSLRALVDRLELEHLELEQQLNALSGVLKALDPPVAIREAFFAFARDLRHHLHLEAESVFFAVERLLHAVNVMHLHHDVGAGLETKLQRALAHAGDRYATASTALSVLGATLREHQQREDILGRRIVAGELWPVQAPRDDVHAAER